MQGHRPLPAPPAAATVAVTLAAAALAACAPGPPRVERRIVLVTIDTLRDDALFGPDRVMPHTEQWSRGGTVFEGYWSASPVTQPAHASLLTGRWPWEHGVTRNGLVLPQEAATVPEALAAAGWRTGAVVASFPLTRAMGLDQGFEVYVDRFDHALGRVWNDFPVEDFYRLASSVTDEALRLAGELGGPSQLLFVHYFDPHAPYGDALRASGRFDGVRPLRFPELRDEVGEGALDAPAALRALEAARGLYRGDAGLLDLELARLLDGLEEEGVETHVVLVADHGESFGEDGSLGHGRHLGPAVLRVPLVVRSPALEPGLRTEPVSSIDVARTLAELAGIDGAPFGGRDLTVRELSPALVAGMRTTTAEPVVDRRADGTLRPLDSPRWFALRDGALYAGDASEVWCEDDETRPAPAEAAAALRPLFARFAGEMREAEARTDATTRAALDALGYAE